MAYLYILFIWFQIITHQMLVNGPIRLSINNWKFYLSSGFNVFLSHNNFLLSSTTASSLILFSRALFWTLSIYFCEFQFVTDYILKIWFNSFSCTYNVSTQWYLTSYFTSSTIIDNLCVIRITNNIIYLSKIWIPFSIFLCTHNRNKYL